MSAPIKTEDLRKLLSAATPGNWLVFTSEDEWGCDTFVGTLTDTLFDVRPWKGPSWQEANAALIALAPIIAAELITARAKLEAAEKLVEAVWHVSDMVADGDTILSSVNHLLNAAIAAWESAK